MTDGMHLVAAATGAGKVPHTIAHAKLERAAHEFESMMLEELMKPLGKNTAVDDIDGKNGDDSGGPLQSFGTQAMASALAQSGALGFATRLVNSLEARTAREGP